MVEIGSGELEEIITYTELCDIIEKQQLQEEENDDNYWTFKSIKGDSGPFNKNSKDYKGSSYNILVEWENGELTYEPLELMIKDDPISVAQYSSEKNLLELPGWKILRRYTKNKKKLKRMVKQAKLASQRRGPIYMFGVRVPRNSREAEVLDKENGNTKWQDAMDEERDQLDDYTTFKNLGKGIFPKDKGYKRINVHFVFAVKHDLRYKARLVAGGHLTDPAK